MQLGLGLSLTAAPLYGGTVGASPGVENYLLDETNAPLLTETGAEILLENT